MNREVFAPDEAGSLQKPLANETAESLLKREGVFFLKDVAPVLDLNRAKFIRETQRLKGAGEDPWKVMGVRRIWNHWLVRMKVFAPYFQERLVRKWRRIPGHWDTNQLLSQSGIFRLADVVRRLPLNQSSIRNQAKTKPLDREVMGVWKDEENSVYLVDMSRFGPWFKNHWQEAE